MSLVSTFKISADDMHITSAMIEAVRSQNIRYEIPAPNAFTVSAKDMHEHKVFDLIDQFRVDSDITLTHVDQAGKDIEGFDFRKCVVEPRMPAF